MALRLALLLLLALPAPAHAWGRLGHRLIGRLAADRLSGPVAAEIRRLLDGVSLADAAMWADSVRPFRPATAPLHYVNIPLAGDVSDWARHCPDGACVVAAIERYRLVLADRTRPPAERAEALRFLVHFVGDLHQPLHVADRGDRGGNDVPVTWQGRATNLHTVWDTRLPEAEGLTEDDYFGLLRGEVRRVDLRAWSGGSVEDWARESHALSRDHAYALPDPPELAGDYARAHLPRARERLVRAGLRLARLLEETLGG